MQMILPNGQNANEILSNTALSNLYTMGCTAEVDPRQCIPEVTTIPPPETLLLRERLHVEEALLELSKAMGFLVIYDGTDQGKIHTLDDLKFEQVCEPSLEDIIDACCDAIYVLTGTLIACGVPDIPHLNAVNRANNAKFPEGKAVADANGKFQKPKDWQPPNHAMTAAEMDYKPKLREISHQLKSMMTIVKGFQLEHTSDREPEDQK
jgi:predicted HAD superfamily Cof-like phosphohydrolase